MSRSVSQLHAQTRGLRKHAKANSLLATPRAGYPPCLFCAYTLRPTVRPLPPPELGIPRWLTTRGIIPRVFMTCPR